MARENNQLQPCPLIQMDLDKTNRVIDWRRGEYRRALNMHFKRDGEMMLVTMDGMVEIPWNRPAGTNEPVGEWQDANLDSAFICFKNSNGNHSIVEIKKNLTVEVIFQSSALEFNLDMGGGALIYEKSIVAAGPGHEIKMLDYLRKIDAAKFVKLTVFLPTSPDVVDQRTFAGTVLLNGVVQATSAGFYTATPGEVFSFTEMVRLFAAGFQADFPTQFTATGCGSWVELEALAVGDWTINLTYTDIIDAVVQPSAPVLWERLNTYMTPMNRWQVNLAKFSPMLAPEVRLINNPRKVARNLDGNCYQFAHRYRFRDGSYSAEGLFTEVVPVSAQVCGLVATPNSIEYDFSNDIPINNPQALAEIASVDIFVRIGTGLWKLARTLEKWEFVYNRTWMFHNDVLLQPFQDAVGPFPVQPQTYVPLRANSIAVATEPNDQATTRLVAAGVHEGFPSPCVPVDIAVSYSSADPNPSSWCTLELRIRVGDLSQDGNYASMQPVGKYGTDIVFGGLSPNDFVETAEARQTLPSGGFIVYVAGTSDYGISEQVILLPAMSCGTVVPTIVPGSRNALDLTVNGTNWASKCQREYRAGARVIIEEGGDIYQRVRIPIQSGRKSVIRFASHRCSASGTGDAYDLSSTSLEWQSTSTNVLGIGYLGQSGTTQGVYECEVDIPAGYTGVWNAGWSMVMSCASVPQTVNIPFKAINTYFIDDNGDDYGPTNDIRTTGTKAEKQISYVGSFDGLGQVIGGVWPAGNQIATIASTYPLAAEIVQGRSATDHNGYSFFSVGVNNLGGINYRMAWLSVTGDPLNPSGIVPAWMNLGVLGATFLTTVNGGNQNKWEGDLNTTNPLTGPATGDLNFTNRIAEYIVPNLGPPGCRDWIRTWLEGTVEDGVGNPLPGMSVVVQRGHNSVTAANGSFSIPFYGDCFVGDVVGANFNNRETDGIYLASTTACTVSFTGGGYSGPYLIDNYEAGMAYSDGVPFPVPLIIGTIVNASAAVSTFPRGWTGRVGLKLYDAHGRQTPVQPIGKEVEIAWKTQDLSTIDPVAYAPGTVLVGKPTLTFSINGPVPTPEFGSFVSYQFCVTRSTRYSRRLDWIIPSASYATEFIQGTGVGTGFNWTAYGSGSAKILVLFMDDSFLRFREINQQTALTDADREFIEISGPGWSYQRHDRAIIATNSSGATRFYDVEITGYRDGGLTIDAASIPEEIIGGEQITLYRPSLEVPEADGIIFYELPLAAYRINDPFGLPSWSTASGPLEGGDHWALPTQIPIRPGNDPLAVPPDVPWTSVTLTRYSQSASDLFPSLVPSTGRAWASIPDAATDYRRSMFRWSQPWYNGSGLAAVTANGIPTFYDIDFKEGGSDLGAIISARFIEDRLIFFGSGGATLSGYIGFVTSQSQGQELLASSSGFISQTREQAVKRGTSSPLSVQRWDTWMFAFDYANASFYAASVNGLDPKEVYGIQQWLRNEMDKFTGYPQPRVCIGVDDKRDEIWLTVEPRTIIVNGNDVEIGNFTIVFEAKNNRFVTFFGAAPRIYTRHKTRLFSVLGGRIWMHDADPAHPGRLYGVDQASHVEVVVNNPVECAWATFSSFGMKGTAEFNDADGEPNRSPLGRISFSPVMKVTSSGINADRGIPPDPGFGRLRSYALSTILTGAAGLKHRILGYLIRGIKTP